MKKIHKILLSLILLLAIWSWVVYATATTAKDRKSPVLPWQWTPSWRHDPAHNVWDSHLPQSRFSFVKWTSRWGNSIIWDSVTWLMWQSDWYASWKMNWDEALGYCRRLVLNWFSDWRLPNKKELESIVDYSRKDLSIDTNYFTAYSYFYWASAMNANYPDYAWNVRFDRGYSFLNYKTYDDYVRCTR